MNYGPHCVISILRQTIITNTHVFIIFSFKLDVDFFSAGNFFSIIMDSLGKDYNDEKKKTITIQYIHSHKHIHQALLKLGTDVSLQTSKL